MRRQLNVKTFEGNSRFVDIKRLCVKYNLPDPFSVLDSPLSSVQFIWQLIHTDEALLYPSLQFLCVEGYWPGRKHPSIQITSCGIDVQNQNQNFTSDTSNDIHSPGPIIWEVSS